ncbi:hypothetical protein [Glutamicibacter ardleyensis]|uniref:hypothetical protein n=1 Tax=Glutamicibacter ardleyensis TaxID=225894 RepID=UPI003FD27BF9
MAKFFDDDSRNQFVDELVVDWIRSVRDAVQLNEHFDKDRSVEKEATFVHDEFVIDFAYMVTERVLHDDSMSVEEVAQKLNEVWLSIHEWGVDASKVFDELDTDYWRGVITATKSFYQVHVNHTLIRLNKHKYIAWIQDRYHTAKTSSAL